LRWLTLTDNAIGHLPTELGQRPALQKLMLAGNRLTALPNSLQAAEKLELLRVSANRLERVPSWLTELPRLAWLALAGNAMGWTLPRVPDLPKVPWAALTPGELLGEGASGHIHRVQATDWPHALALKLFKGAVTSDGLPQDELAACLAAGQHPSLTTPVARLTDHPTQAQGLLMPLIPAAHINLAGPPSLQSCTRDVYPPGFQLSTALALGIAKDVTGALAHLHQRGVMHGDLYAHNILMDPVHGQARLGDFGAATRLPGDTPELRQSLLALEVRALGCLLEELALAVQSSSSASALTPWHHESGTSSTTGDSIANAALQTLQALARACLSEQPRQRPTAAEVAQALQTLKL
jgi:serine/threonine protein kinase